MLPLPLRELDLSFAEVAEEPVAEVEEVEEPEEEETVSKDEQSTEEETESEEETAELEEEEAEAEPESIADEKPAKKPMVPKARLDEVLAKQKALQKQLDEINAANE